MSLTVSCSASTDDHGYCQCRPRSKSIDYKVRIRGNLSCLWDVAVAVWPCACRKSNPDILVVVCAESPIRVDGAMDRLSWWNDRAVLFRSGSAGLAIRVEVAA